MVSDVKKNFSSNWDTLNLITVPLFLGGIKFAPNEKNTIWNDFADSDWFIPKYLFLMQNNNYFLIYNFLLDPKSSLNLEMFVESPFNLIQRSKDKKISDVQDIYDEPNLDDTDDKNQWLKKVNEGLQQVANGKVEKIVLSRQVELSLQDTPILSNLLNKLSSKYPRCFIFAYKNNESTFFGASPERLAKFSNGYIEADALAGSTPRGNTKDEDDNLADELLNSKKNLAEQNAVVRFIANSFSTFAEDINYDQVPKILKLPNIQHLWTPIKAKLKTDEIIFALLKEIHPTPAICGVPWDASLDLILEIENHTRGLFAGVVGWFNFDQEGEFAVAIRSALIKQKNVYAYAGCGIIEGSDPFAEYEETKLKLNPILSLFKNENVYQS
jgi:menaquinone-specific isochorismate synthase